MMALHRLCLLDAKLSFLFSYFGHFCCMYTLAASLSSYLAIYKYSNSCREPPETDRPLIGRVEIPNQALVIEVMQKTNNHAIIREARPRLSKRCNSEQGCKAETTPLFNNINPDQ